MEPKLRIRFDEDGNKLYQFWCLGCYAAHSVTQEAFVGEIDLVLPNIHMNYLAFYNKCYSVIIEGIQFFYKGSLHEFSGMKVTLPNFDDLEDSWDTRSPVSCKW